MKISFLFFHLMTIMFLFLGVARGQSTSSAAPTFSLAINTKQDVVKIGSMFRVEVVLKNISQHEIGFLRSPAEDNGEGSNFLDVHDDKGDLAPETGYKRAIEGRPNKGDPNIMIGGSEITITLKPGDSAKETILVNRLYDLKSPGKYTISCRRFDVDRQTFVNSNTITVSVTP